jgi:hypothetical protein
VGASGETLIRQATRCLGAGGKSIGIDPCNTVGFQCCARTTGRTLSHRKRCLCRMPAIGQSSVGGGKERRCFGEVGRIERWSRP